MDSEEVELDSEEILQRLRDFRPKELFRVGPDRFFHELVTLAARLGGTHMNSLYMTDPTGEKLQLKAAIGLPSWWLEAAREIPIGLDPSSGVCGRAAALGQPVVAESLDDPAVQSFGRWARAAGIGALWSVPLVDSDGHVIGTFATHHPEPRTVSSRQIRMIQEVARHAAHVLETARLYHAQEAVWKVQRRAQLLAQQLITRTRPEQVFAAVADGLKELLQVDVVWLSHVRGDGAVRFFQSEALFAEPPVHIGDAPCREALDAQRPVVHTDFAPPAGARLLRPLRLGTLVCYPQRVEDGHVFTSVGWYRSHRFSEEEEHVLDLFTKFGALALQNATRLELLRSSYMGMVRGLLTALEMRDLETVAHSRRVVTYTLLLRERVGLGAQDIDQVMLGAALHDVGKIGISDRILLKRGRLPAAEYERVKAHPVLGHHMLQMPLAQFPVALDMVRHHHERYDGTGYPDGLAEQDISLEARLLAVADAFDVMTTDRNYRRARSVAAARREVAAWRGKQFCPVAADALLSLETDILEAVRRGELDRSPFGAADTGGMWAFRRASHDPLRPR